MTAKILINNIPEAEHLTSEDISKLVKYQNEVFLFLGANDLRPLENNFKNYLN